MSKQCLAFIPARGGSKRLKNKNILSFDGNPLIHYTIIEALKHPTYFKKVVVSTDSDEIASLASKYGCEVVERPAALSSDFSSTAEAAQHTLIYFKEQGLSFDAIVTMQPTNPLRPPQLIEECLHSYFKEPDIHSLITVSPNKKKIGLIDHSRYVSQNYTPGQRSQDLSKQYFENGLLYVSNPDLVIEKQNLFGQYIYPYIVDHWSGYIDIDNQHDFDIAEFLYKKYKSEFN